MCRVLYWRLYKSFLDEFLFKCYGMLVEWLFVFTFIFPKPVNDLLNVNMILFMNVSKLCHIIWLQVFVYLHWMNLQVF